MSYKPPMLQLCTRVTGAGGFPPNSTRFTDQPCGFWLSKGRQSNRVSLSEPTIIGQVALAMSLGWQMFTPAGNPQLFNPNAADRLTIKTTGGPNISVFAVTGGPMWAGTADEHWRVLVCFPYGNVVSPVITFPTGRTDGIPLTVSISRPFGGAVVATGVSATRYPDFPSGRGGYSGGQYIPWTDYFDVAASIDIRDASSRAAGLPITSYSDGDRITVTAGGPASIYVVALVQLMKDLNGTAFKRAYVIRDQAAWPGP